MMKKLISGLVLLAMLACLVLPAAAAEPTALPMTVAEAVDGVSAYCTAAMQAAGTYSDWSILQLARSGNLTDAMRQDYLASLAEKLRACGGVLDKSYYTQYSRTILALTACGENARDFAGYDLTAPLANYDQTVWQGVNGAAFALIAMDSVSLRLRSLRYELPRAPRGLPAGAGAAGRRLGLFRQDGRPRPDRHGAASPRALPARQQTSLPALTAP